MKRRPDPRRARRFVWEVGDVRVESLRALEDAHAAVVEAGDVDRAKMLARTIGDTRASLASDEGPMRASDARRSAAEARAAEVAALVKGGKSTAQIAKKLHVSISTVKRARRRARRT